MEYIEFGNTDSCKGFGKIRKKSYNRNSLIIDVSN